MSYRQVRKVIASFLAEKNWPLVIPSATSVRNWVRKLSYYRLCYDVYTTEIDLGDKVLLLDLSGGIGREKALVILGVDVKAWHCAAQALTFSDICVLSVKTGTTWNSDTISAEIDSVKGKIGGNVPYIVTDRDSTVQSACRQSGLVNVSDCTHWQSNCLERYYKNDEAFKLLHAELGKIRQKWVNSKLSALIAPNMRTKSRFLNLYEIIDWLDKLTSHFDKLDPKIQETLGFIQHHKVLIEELILMINLIKKISKILKIKGLNAQTELDVKDLFGKISHKTTILTRFEQDMTHYMHQIRMMLPNQNNIMCCDDVIESVFGKFKNRGNKGASQGITEDVMTIALFNGHIEIEQTKDALEQIKLKDIEQWADKNIAPSFAKAKNAFWRNLVPKRA